MAVILSQDVVIRFSKIAKDSQAGSEKSFIGSEITNAMQEVVDGLVEEVGGSIVAEIVYDEATTDKGNDPVEE